LAAQNLHELPHDQWMTKPCQKPFNLKIKHRKAMRDEQKSADSKALSRPMKHQQCCAQIIPNTEADGTKLSNRNQMIATRFEQTPEWFRPENRGVAETLAASPSIHRTSAAGSRKRDQSPRR